MQHLSTAELTELVQAIAEQHGHGLSKVEFTGACFDMFEDISGMEGVSTQDAMEITNLLWSTYMTKSAPEATFFEPINHALYKEAIRSGKQTLAEEGTKAAAARVIFNMLKDESREVVIQAFIEGASITPKGGPTYFYNINRKMKKLGKH